MTKTSKKNRGGKISVNRLRHRLIRWFWLGGFVVATGSWLSFNVYRMTTLSKFDSAKRNVLQKTQVEESTLSMIEISLDDGDLKTADLLLSTVPVNRTVSLSSGEKDVEGVLGVETSKIEELYNKREALSREGVRRLIERWEMVKKNYVLYRDAYLQLAILYSNVRDYVSAGEYWKIAYELDPNSEKVERVRKIIENKGVIK